MGHQKISVVLKQWSAVSYKACISQNMFHSTKPVATCSFWSPWHSFTHTYMESEDRFLGKYVKYVYYS